MLFAYRTRGAVAHPLAIVMLVFPLAFYLTHTSLRYRFPMDPVMLVLAVSAVGYALSPKVRRRAEEQSSATASEQQAVAPEEPATVLR
jgi:hypothetical protein